MHTVCMYENITMNSINMHKNYVLIKKHKIGAVLTAINNDVLYIWKLLREQILSVLTTHKYVRQCIY